MAYIVVVNPAILATTGIDQGAAFVATCVGAAVAPIARAIPEFATAPALVFVACLMARALKDVNWDDMTDYLPAVVTAIAMPFSFSIATGIGLGFVVHAVVKTIAGKWAEVGGAVWLIAAASVLRFALT
jgi:AGZA family xanthine/uracil permease-like MFS transporter